MIFQCKGKDKCAQYKMKRVKKAKKPLFHSCHDNSATSLITSST